MSTLWVPIQLRSMGGMIFQGRPRPPRVRTRTGKLPCGVRKRRSSGQRMGFRYFHGRLHNSLRDTTVICADCQSFAPDSGDDLPVTVDAAVVRNMQVNRIGLEFLRLQQVERKRLQLFIQSELQRRGLRREPMEEVPTVVT